MVVARRMPPQDPAQDCKRRVCRRFPALVLKVIEQLDDIARSQDLCLE
jgi:hypothetical protein